MNGALNFSASPRTFEPPSNKAFYRDCDEEEDEKDEKEIGRK
jgi:hypothetical protein